MNRGSNIGRPWRPCATYSIVAAEPDGTLGVAVQSHWFNVGAVVPWVETGVGAVAVQSFSGPEIGVAAMGHLRRGLSPDEVLATVLRDDIQRAGGQIAIVTPGGTVATHTGEGCIPEAGHVSGTAYSAQANLMDTDQVWGAMVAVFESAPGDLADRLLAALFVAESVGGDIRGRQSAAILVAEPGHPFPLDRIFDLHVEDHPDPVSELHRLVRIRRAFIQLNEGDRLVARGEVAEALAAYREATDIVDDAVADGEAAFWTAVALANDDELNEAEAFMRRAAAKNDRWARLIPRLVDRRILPDDQALVDRLIQAATQR
jgi:uncharacterized Ntn-hydrolase superfamily protein